MIDRKLPEGTIFLPQPKLRYPEELLTDRIEAFEAENERLRRCIKDCPTRADYTYTDSFIYAHRNWEFHHVRAALGERHD